MSSLKIKTNSIVNSTGASVFSVNILIKNPGETEVLLNRRNNPNRSPTIRKAFIRTSPLTWSLQKRGFIALYRLRTIYRNGQIIKIKF